VIAVPSRVEDVAEFYHLLADDYDAVAGYTDSGAEKLRAPIKKLFRECLRGHKVLEIACGTGYWTEVIAASAEFVLATDISESMISLAGKRLAGFPNMECRVADAYSLESVTGAFTAGFAHWWWSHVPKSKLPVFLDAFHGRLEDGALVLLADHLREGWQEQKYDTEGNSLDLRTLPDGREFEVVKNFPTCDEVVGLLARFAENVDYVAHPELRMWTVTYIVRK
jgi:SAM-dependent methyltransferase